MKKYEITIKEPKIAGEYTCQTDLTFLDAIQMSIELAFSCRKYIFKVKPMFRDPDYTHINAIPAPLNLA